MCGVCVREACLKIMIYGVVWFFALLYAVSERLGLKRTLSGTLRLVHVCENKVLGPWDEQLQE